MFEVDDIEIYPAKTYYYIAIKLLQLLIEVVS